MTQDANNENSHFQWLDASSDVIDVDFDLFPAEEHMAGKCGVSVSESDGDDAWWQCIECEERRSVVCEKEAKKSEDLLCHRLQFRLLLHR